MATVVAQAATRIVTPSIDWSALWPVIVLALGAVLLLTFSSLLKGKPLKGIYAVYTVVVGPFLVCLSCVPAVCGVGGVVRLPCS